MPKFKAVIIESERGWGSKIDERLEFDTEQERDEYVEAYNRKHNPEMYEVGHRVPDWYMIAKAV